MGKAKYLDYAMTFLKHKYTYLTFEYKKNLLINQEVFFVAGTGLILLTPCFIIIHINKRRASIISRLF